MSSLQSLRELISERLAAAAEEICRLCEGTIVQYEQELCRQRRLLDICWKPQLQLHHIVFSQHCMTEEDPSVRQSNFRVDLGEPKSPQIKEWKEPDPPQIKDEQKDLFISQDEKPPDLKQEADTLMEIPNCEKNEHSQDEEGSQHEGTTSQSGPQKRDQSKRRDRSHVQNVNSSHRSESDYDRNPLLGKKCKQSPKGKISSHIKIISHNVSTHMTTESDRQYVCTECGISFGYLSQFKIHMRAHIGKKCFPCKQCDRSFTHMSKFKRHMKSHTEKKPYPCKECGKSFSHMFYFKRHIRIHTGEKPFPCKECGMSFRQIPHLKIHMRTHTREKPFLCEECQTRFSRKSNLKVHMRTHTGEKPYTCKECHASFSLKGNLKRHMVTHTGEKPFLCKECHQSFHQIYNLKRHENSHRREVFSV